MYCNYVIKVYSFKEKLILLNFFNKKLKEKSKQTLAQEIGIQLELYQKFK